MSSVAPKAGTKIAVMWIAIAIGSVGASTIFAAASLADSVSRVARKHEILLAGAPDRGIFDPSIAGDGRQLYMTVSGVSSTTAGSSLGVTDVRSYLGRSQDQGRTWQLVGGAVNPDVEASLDDFPSPHRGRWQSEVTALAFDPDAPQTARWKLFWHQYLNVNGERRFEHGWLAYKEAETPEQLASARPVKLVTARGYDPVNDQSAGRTKSRLAGPAVIRIHELNRGLARCAAVSEPGVLAKPDALYLALICFRGSLFGLFEVSNQVVLLKCRRPCDATRPEGWSYAGTVLSQRDAEALGMGSYLPPIFSPMTATALSSSLQWGRYRARVRTRVAPRSPSKIWQREQSPAIETAGHSWLSLSSSTKTASMEPVLSCLMVRTEGWSLDRSISPHGAAGSNRPFAFLPRR